MSLSLDSGERRRPELSEQTPPIEQSFFAKLIHTPGDRNLRLLCRNDRIPNSGRQDLNLRPLDPQSSALAKLRHAPQF